MSVRRWGAVAMALAIAAAAATAPSAAAAQDFSADGPLWYLDAMKIQAIHDGGITGDGVTVAVFDAALDPEVSTLEGADIEVRQAEGCPDPLSGNRDDFEGLKHGTSVTSLIVGNGTSDSGAGPVGIAPGVRILYYGILQDSCEGDTFPAALDDAVAQGADIVTMSGGLNRLADELSQDSVDSVATALREGVLVVAGLPNRDTVWEFVTTTVNGVVNVASVDASAQAATQLDGSAMVNEDVDIVAPGIDVAGLGFDQTWGMSAWSGNSAATPIVASLLALAKQKWPDASGSQLLQSMIRNTGSTPHELQWSDTFGHGIINATRLVQEDPTQYPDENPLFKDDQSPSFEEVFSTTGTEPTGEPSAEDGSGPGALPWMLGGGAVIVIAVAATAILIGRKKSGGRADV